MHLGDPLDPAIEAATLALGTRGKGPTSGFASIELRGKDKTHRHLAPLGYALSVIAGLGTVAFLWLL